MKLINFFFLSVSFQFTLKNVDNEDLCLKHNGTFVPVSSGCDQFDGDDVAMHSGNPSGRTCFDKDYKGFHVCGKKETNFVELVMLGDTVSAWITNNHKPMKFDSGKWVKSDFVERTVLISDSLFWG